PSTFNARPQSAEWNRVHQSTLVPQRVRSTFKLEATVLANVALIAFAIIPDLLDDAVSPFVVDTHELAEVAAFAEQPLHGRVARGGQHLVDVGRGHSVFLSLQHRHHGPADDV